MTPERPGCTTAIWSGWNGSRSRRGSKAPESAPAPPYRRSLPAKRGSARPLSIAPRAPRPRPRAGRPTHTCSCSSDMTPRVSGAASQSELLRAGPGKPVTCQSLGNDAALRDVLMKVVVEIVAARTERGQAHGDRLAGLDRLFAVQPKALEFDRLVARVYDLDRDG